MRKTILAFPADTHCGSTVGLMPPRAWQLDDDSGTYHPSRKQRIIWRQWAECWETVRDLRQPGDRVIITTMGDLVDGKHHDTSELVTQRTEEQERIFIDCFEWAMDTIGFGGDDLLQMIAGTPAHVREGFQSERRIAEDLDAKPKLYDRHKFDVHGVKFDVAHQRFGVGRRTWTEGNSLKAILRSMLYMWLLQNDTPADYVIGAHLHFKDMDSYEGGKYKIRGAICPPFQLPTLFGKMVTNNSTRKPDIGMLIVTVNEDGTHDWQCPCFKFPKERYVRL